MALALDDLQTEAIIARIIDHIEVEKNGYARVGWAIEQVMIDHPNKKMFGTRDYLIKKIASLITASGKYIKENSTVNKLATDFDILRNPNYKPDIEKIEEQVLSTAKNKTVAIADIFISYSRKDIALAKFLANEFTMHGWKPWLDSQIPVGKDYDLEIENNLHSSKCVLVIWTENSIVSRNVKDEANEALINNKLIPIVIGYIRPPMGFRMLQSLNFPNGLLGDAALINELFDEISDLIGKPVSNISSKEDNDLIAIETNSRKVNLQVNENEEENEKTPFAFTDLEILKEFLHFFIKNDKYYLSYTYVSPSIPRKKEARARNFFNIPADESLIGLMDFGTWADRSEQVAFTCTKMYYNHISGKVVIPYSKIASSSITLLGITSKLNDQKICIDEIELRFETKIHTNWLHLFVSIKDYINNCYQNIFPG